MQPDGCIYTCITIPVNVKIFLPFFLSPSRNDAIEAYDTVGDNYACYHHRCTSPHDRLAYKFHRQKLLYFDLLPDLLGPKTTRYSLSASVFLGFLFGHLYGAKATGIFLSLL